jgi:hypothetical protein
MKMNFSKLGGITHVFKYGDRLQPVRDWFLMVFIVIILLLISLGWNAWLFERAISGEAIGTATAAPALNPTSIDSVTAVFQKRAEQETLYKNGHFIDPSVPAS